ncbi:coiled-coil domain-containing protein 142 isoform X1 [Pezoporus flaviventris]|uniref:coiled-coil domain-containing protein 142 isoform X1 n=1 Tax=Pezoporus flaviventris TaxID=889875 RepID=UPI002AAF48FF|nr:coiled-coil domain-containing protein 142 isoform X1 [Pezoporus flaviventris]
MEDGGRERRGAEPCPQDPVRDVAGPGGLVPLLLPALPAPGDGDPRGASPEPGSSSRGPLSRSLRKAEAMLRGCVSPGLRRLLPPRPRRRGPGSEDEDEDEDEEEASALLTPLERSFPGLRRCLCVREDPRTETFHGHVRPPPCDADTADAVTTAAAFSFHPVHPRVAERGAALHALLRQRHLLRLARDYSRRLQAASGFLRRLLALLQEPVPELDSGPPLRELCRELRVHTGHWGALRRRLRGDPWLRALVLHRGEAVAHMRRALVLLALQALSLAEHLAEARLRALARTGSAAASLPELLSDLFQGLDIYNRAVGDLEPELGAAGCLPTGTAGRPGAAEASSRPFPASRVLQIVAAERGWLAAGRLRPFLQLRAGAGGDEPVRWEDTEVPWLPEHGSAADTDSCGREEHPSMAGTLRALCREDEELMGLLLGVLVASSGSFQHHVLHVPKEKPPAAAPGPPEPQEPGWAGWTSVPAAQALLARYRPLFWDAAAAALGHGAELLPGGTLPAAALELSGAIGAAPVPRECREELGRLSLSLLCRGALRSWDTGFTCALGSALSDKCSGDAVPASGPVRSRTATLLHRLYPALALALRCLRPPPGQWGPGRGTGTRRGPAPHLIPTSVPPDLPPGPPCLRLQVLGCCLATVQAAHSWLTGRACRYLAAWALPQFLLVTQGDLQLLKMETDKLVLLVKGTFPEPGDVSPPLPLLVMSNQELQLCQRIRSMATSIQLFSGDVLKMFSTGCKRMSAQIFHQTMPRGKHWRISLRAELPSCPSAYAAAAAQAVLGQVLQGARLLPRDAQAPAMAGGTTAFLEAWMEHILEHRIRFSLQGALQLRQDFELVRELVASERSGLAPETRRELVALSVFQQMDGAILCLLQQPGAAARAGARPWNSLRHCCSDNGSHPPEPAAGILQGLDTLEAPVPVAPAPCPAGAAGPARPGVPESYLSGRQQQWLALRLHRARRWRVPGLPCIRDPSGQ